MKAFLVQNPKFDSLIGEWEETAPMIYAKLIVHSTDSNILITVDENLAIHKFTLNGYKTLENGFEVLVVDQSGKSEPEKMKGTFLFGKLVLEPNNSKDRGIWFIRSEDLSKYQEIVNGEISKYGNQFDVGIANNSAQVD